MIDCPIFWIPPTPTGIADPPVDDVIACSGCNCGYLLYENLITYMPEIQDALKADAETYPDLEFKLREQIVEVSRLFDIDAGVEPGHFSKAHYKTTKIVTSNGSQYIRIPEFVDGTLEVRTLEDIVLDESTYAVENGHLVYYPCVQHVNCACTCSGEVSRPQRFLKWPNGCYKITARWGKTCSDFAVQRAIRDYLLEAYRMSDPIVTLANGIPVQRKFQIPHSWDAYIRNFKAKRRIFSEFAIA